MALDQKGGLLATAQDPNAAMMPPTAVPDATMQAASHGAATTATGASGSSPGMINDWYQSYMSKPPATANATAATAGTTAWKPGASATVQGQLTSVLDAGGPLQDRAATKAAQTMNGRGLLNSSMAITAGQSALYDAALPIAQQDATVNANAGQFNANASNTAALTNAGLATDVSKTNAGAVNTATGAQAQQGATAVLQANDITNQNAMQAKDLASRYDLANLDVASRASLQAADAANQQKLQAANAVLQTGLQATDNAVKQSMQAYQLGVQQAMQGKDNETKMAVATLDANTQSKLAEVNNKYKVQLQTSQSMAVTYQSMVDGITKVMTDPTMDFTAKQDAINNLTKLYNGSLDMQSNLTGLNLGNLLGGLTTPGANADGSAPRAPVNTTEPSAPNYIPPANQLIDSGGE